MNYVYDKHMAYFAFYQGTVGFGISETFIQIKCMCIVS